MSTIMEEFAKRTEKDLAVPNLPQFKNKEEVVEHARQRLAAKRNRAATGSVQGTAGFGSDTESAIRSHQGNGRSYTADRIRANTEGRPQAYAVHAGDGRDAAGTRSSNGYFDDVTIRNRVDAGVRTGPDQHDGSTGYTGEPEVHAPSRKGARGGGLKGFRSKMKTYVNTAFAPIEKESSPKVTAAPQRRAAAPARGGKWRPLSEAEAAQLHPKLVQYITWQSEHLDQFIIATTKGHDPTIEIWADLDEAEIEILADYLINRGRRDGTTAQAVRYAAEILDRIKVAVIVLPRVYRTVNVYLARGLDIQIFVRPQY